MRNIIIIYKWQLLCSYMYQEFEIVSEPCAIQFTAQQV